MKTVLHILTRPDDGLGACVIREQTKVEALEVWVVDLSANDPDYDRLLEMIFEAQEVQVW
ncbi:MAG TPA: hypothetical protein P5186_23195 [Candidatus Paceibacterota bacterium]|nr:hypothetical protein [Verrucomicrobiota bacterium]HRY50964.1 hypothetical protein [Candidatus Paceibacterota bacterium]